MEIIIDDREKAIFPYLEDASNKYNITYKIQRNEVGDYAITHKGYILMIIERKTWNDLSASMRDGRKANIQKLTALREQTGCQIAYLIEGNATPPFDKKFGRLPLKNLRAHLDHLAFRDGVHMLYAKDLEYTATRIFEVAQNYSTLKEILKDIDEINTDTDTGTGTGTGTDTDTGTGTGTDGTTGGDVSKLKEKQVTEKSSLSINEQVLRCLPGVGSIISSLLAENGVTLSKLYYDAVSVDDIAMYKYPTGACIGLPVATKILANAKKTFTSTSDASHKARVRILTTIPLISKTTAEKMLEEINLLDILDGSTDVDELATFQKTEKAKLGKKAAGNIIKYLKG
jgi:ERCC4-type nuclease